MKKFFVAAMALVMGLTTACNKGLDNASKEENDSMAMVTGFFMGKNAQMEMEIARMQGMGIDSEAFLKGFKDGLQDTTKFAYYYGAMQGVQTAMGHMKDSVSLKKFFEYYEAGFRKDSTKMTMTEAQASEWYSNWRRRKEEARMMSSFGENKKAGEAAIAKFAQQEGVITTASGLAYRVIKEGTGKTPTATDNVLMSYRGTLIDGTEFDKSGEEARQFNVSGVIPGWTEMLQLMKEGGEVEVYIPQELGYGSKDLGNIPPFSTLIFTMKMEKVLPASAN